MHPAVFLDRDNTLIHNDGDLGDPRKVQLIQGAASAVASLRGLGYRVVVVSNQGGVARGRYKEKDVEAVHRRIAELIAAAANGARIDAFYYCPYHPEGKVAKYRREHPNRKPAPGMLLQAAEQMDLDLKRSWTIGDQVRDVQAGAAAGTRTILLREDADQLTPLDTADLIAAHDESAGAGAGVPNFYARSLVEAVRIIAQQRKPDADPPPARALAGERKWDAAAVAQLQRESRAKPARAAPAPPSPRPFRPWNAPAPEAPQPPEETPPDGASPRTEAAGPSAMPGSAAPARAPASAGAPTPPAPAAGPTSDTKLLRQILQELRHQRGSHEQPFTYLTVTAIVVQMVAVLCLLGALWMGAGGSDLFQRWALAGLIAQGATIALLLFAHRT